jgi:hypothetical protein
LSALLPVAVYHHHNSREEFVEKLSYKNPLKSGIIKVAAEGEA